MSPFINLQCSNSATHFSLFYYTINPFLNIHIDCIYKHILLHINSIVFEKYFSGFQLNSDQNLNRCEQGQTSINLTLTIGKVDCLEF